MRNPAAAARIVSTMLNPGRGAPHWPPAPGAARAFVIVNEAAGGVGRGAADALRAQLGAAGVEIVALADDVAGLQAHQAAVRDAGMIVVLGGDGTARAAAEAFRDGPPLLLLPGGTLNVLPRALYGDRAWREALSEALTAGKVRRLVGGRANGKPFFVAALFGGPTLLARAREAMREGRVLEAARRLRHAMARLMSRKLLVRPSAAAFSVAAAAGVLCPSYIGELEDDALEWVRLDVNRLTDFARVGLLSVLGGWRDDDTIQLSRAARGEIRSIGVVPALLDGESAAFFSRVRVEIMQDGPFVVALS